MVLMLELKPDLEKRLRKGAEESGMPAEDYAVRLLDQTLQSGTESDPLELATGIYEGLDDSEIDEIEKIILQRRPLFERQSSTR